ncbi:MAG: polysaccharide biosynthesis protein [Candidatus Riflebacteria bacterium]|nr:polysaccharide biosynthesis protein [Candidatus Riflebacteria bacterium]
MIKFLRTTILICLDFFCFYVSFILAIWLRFERIEDNHFHILNSLFLPFGTVLLIVFWSTGLYNRSLRFASIPDLIAVFNSVSIFSLLKLAIIYFFQAKNFSRTVILNDWLINLAFVASTRLSFRILLDMVEAEPFRTIIYGPKNNKGKRVLIYGAGRAGESVAREIRRNEFLPFDILGILDDDPRKKGKIIHGIPVLGGRETLNQVISDKRIEEIIIAIPSAPGEVLREILKVCRDTKIRFKTLPGLQSIIDGKLFSLQLKDIAIEDLLRRPPAKINLAEIAAYVTDKIVLVTGAGGSIGSEICRQILGFSPSKLILLGHGENSIYNIYHELFKKRNNTELVPMIADIQDKTKVDHIFKNFSPQIVFHAAAHKHVPLMEANCTEAVKNNVFGSKNLVEAAHLYKCERYVMISTDKAVNPTSVMGATKRVAEMVLKCYAKKSATRFVAVRFGNVLGSRGSVIPLFKSQIEKGGPITITHPNMIRYFMTIPEASKLVIQAGAYGKGGEVFVLDMGEPVKIVDLAYDLIRLAGLEVGKDIEVVFNGLRPGEKLYEELLTAEEGISATINKMIFIAPPEEINEEAFLEDLSELEKFAYRENANGIFSTLKKIVPKFFPDRDAIFNEPKIKILREKEINPKFKEKFLHVLK